MTKISFTEHPKTVGETYIQHLQSAWYFSFRMFFGAIACFFHGLFPFLFVRTGSSTVSALYDRMIKHRSRSSVLQPPNADGAPVETGNFQKRA